MKSFIATIVTLFAVAAFAADTAKPTVAPTAPVVAKEEAKKPVKSHQESKTVGAKKATGTAPAATATSAPAAK